MEGRVGSGMLLALTGLTWGLSEPKAASFPCPCQPGPNLLVTRPSSQPPGPSSLVVQANDTGVSVSQFWARLSRLLNGQSAGLAPGSRRLLLSVNHNSDPGQGWVVARCRQGQDHSPGPVGEPVSPEGRGAPDALHTQRP